MPRPAIFPPLPDGVLVRAGAWAVFVFALTLPAAMLAVADRGWVAVAIAAVLLAASAVVRRWRAETMVAGGAVLLGALWGGLAYDGVEQNDGGLTMRITDPGQLTGDAGARLHRRGRGAVIVDLRALDVSPAPGGPGPPPLQLSAQADTDHLLIALPERACVRLKVRYRRIAKRPEIFATLGRPVGLATDADTAPEPLDRGSALTERESRAEQAQRHRRGIPHFVAYGRPVDGDGTWVREASDPAAPTVIINAAAAGQIVIRNYPGSVDLPSDATWPLETAPARPATPAGSSWLTYPDGTAALLTRTGVHLEEEYWARVTAWAQAEAHRWVGPCATQTALAAQRIDIGRGPTAARIGRGAELVDVNGLGVTAGARDRGPSSGYEALP